jgi:hypothetical protein
MRNTFFSLILILTILLLSSANSAFADGPAPPPPGHSLNGNQASPGGTGCPVDRSTGLTGVLVLSLAFAGFYLYRQGKKVKAAAE